MDELIDLLRAHHVLLIGGAVVAGIAFNVLLGWENLHILAHPFGLRGRRRSARQRIR